MSLPFSPETEKAVEEAAAQVNRDTSPTLKEMATLRESVDSFRAILAGLESSISSLEGSDITEQGEEAIRDTLETGADLALLTLSRIRRVAAHVGKAEA